MSDEYENKAGYEEQNSSDESYYGKYTGGAGEKEENGYAYKTVMDGVPRSRGWSVASMVLGILSVICCCITYGGLIMGLLAIVFAVVSRRNLGYFDGMAIAGLVLGIIGAVFGIMTIISDIYLSANPELFENYLKYLESLEANLEGGAAGTTDGF